MAGLGVQPREGLVQHHQLGRVDQRADDGQLLLHAVGIGADRLGQFRIITGQPPAGIIIVYSVLMIIFIIIICIIFIMLLKCALFMTKYRAVVCVLYFQGLIDINASFILLL